MDKLNMQTTNIVDENIQKIGELFPNCLTERLNDEGKPEVAIDFDQLKQELSKDIVEGPEERYQFTWPEKRKAILLANTAINKTLRPIRTKSINFDETKNIYIEGDNLDVLKTLQEAYLHKIDVIYIDPPYNTGNNLLYHNNFFEKESDYITHSGMVDEDGNYLVQNKETNGRFHTEWLNMMYPRLLLSKNLLKESGVLICAIDQSELNTLGIILKQIFADKEVMPIAIVHNPSGTQGLNFSVNNEYAYFVYNGDRKSIAFEKRTEETADVRSFMNGAKGNTSNYLRTSGYGCFYPIIVKNDVVIGFGNVVDKNEHPKGPNEMQPDGSIYVYPIDQDGVERKWLFARETVESVKQDLHVKYNAKRKCYEIIRIKSEINYKTVWTDKKYNAKTYGTSLLNTLMDNVFTFPKSIYTVKDCVQAAIHDKNNAIILDFFSGSATTAHAVMELNVEDGGKRQFILVQLPEPVQNNNNYNTICDIGEERIRRAGKKIKEESPLTTQNLDTGFRVLKLDSSNMEDVYYTPEDFDERSLFNDNIKPDRLENDGEDLLFQVMIELGIVLSAKIEKKEIAGKTVWNVSDGYLLACFDENVNESTITAIAKQQPYYFVMRDASLATDNVADNFEQIWQEYSKDTIRRIL